MIRIYDVVRDLIRDGDTSLDFFYDFAPKTETDAYYQLKIISTQDETHKEEAAAYQSRYRVQIDYWNSNQSIAYADDIMRGLQTNVHDHVVGSYKYETEIINRFTTVDAKEDIPYFRNTLEIYVFEWKIN